MPNKPPVRVYRSKKPRHFECLHCGEPFTTSGLALRIHCDLCGGPGEETDRSLSRRIGTNQRGLQNRLTRPANRHTTMIAPAPKPKRDRRSFQCLACEAKFSAGERQDGHCPQCSGEIEETVKSEAKRLGLTKLQIRIRRRNI